MAEPVRQKLNVSRSIVLDAAGNGTATLAPEDFPGPANWHVDGVIIQTNRPGQAPIPRVQVYMDTVSPANSQGLSYDGSFSQGAADLNLSRGNTLLAVWAAGGPGDIASMTITGEKW